MAKMWQGRFSKDLDEKVNDFNSSISFDSRMYKEDISGSIIHSVMLGKKGIISEEDSRLIGKELSAIYDEIESGKLAFDPTAEDIHMFIESVLTERLGEVGKRLHTARSRNDQVALDLRMYLRGQIDVIVGLIKSLIKTLVEKAEENLETVMPGYTHLQRAQPITFAHHLMAYVEMFKRDMVRMFNCFSLMNECPLGSGALATTTYPIDREFTAKHLGFDNPTYNSLDGVSDRDYAIELASAISICMMHLSRLSEEIVLWSSWEFKFIELDDAYATGSSIMPQKKNPDICELIRGKTVDTVKLCLSTIKPMLDTMTVNKENMKKAGEKGFINATDCADYLVKKGLAFRDAYKIVGTLVGICVEKDTTLDKLDIAEYKKICDVFEEDVYTAIDLNTCVKGRNVTGGPAPEAVKKHIDLIKNTVLKEEKQ